MQKFRSRPVDVEAVRLTKMNFSKVAEWCDGMIIKDGRAYSMLIIKTIEGEKKAQIGDWITRNKSGDFDAYDPYAFHGIFEKV